MSDDTDLKTKGPGARPTAGAPHVKPVPSSGTGSTADAISPKHMEDLLSSGLTLETIELAGIRSESKSKPIADILGRRGWNRGGGMVLPFRDYDSRKVVLSRVKPDKPRLRGKKSKPVKYEQASGTGAVPYFGPRCVSEQRLDRSALSVCWVEGEKKALCLDQLGFAAIGVTGCHNWNDAEAHRNGDGITWAKALRKYAERFVKGRAHVLVFDSDAATNDNVMLALQRLAGLLLQDGAASVRFVQIPPDPTESSGGVGIDDYYVANGEAATRLLFKQAVLVEVGGEVAPIPPKDPLLKLCRLAWLKGAELASDLRLPPRFEVRRDRSLWLEPPLDKPDGDQKEMMRAVLLPTALLQSVDDDEQRMEVTHFVRGEWHRSIVDRRALRDARRALAELPPNAAIDSNNAALVVLWLSEYMRHNEHRLPMRKYVGKCGWHSIDDASCFLVHEPIVPPASNSTVSIVADESGDRGEMLRALKPKGDLDAHTRAIKRAFDEDRVCALMILGALAAPLLKPLDAPNFAMHLFGDSSRGKTSKMVCAASVYGDPHNEQWVGSWNATGTAMELRAETLNDLPLFFDEIGAGDKGSIERWIYMLINGSGKSRAGRSLRLRKTPSWRTVVGSTGEHLIANDDANTGAQVRVLQYRVSGFGTLDASGVDDFRKACASNAGHVGRLWLEHLVSVEDWGRYRAVFRAAKSQFQEQAGGALMGRQAVFYALLALAEHVASSTLGIGLKGGATVRAMFQDTDNKREIKTAGERALASVAEWVASEPHSFPALSFSTDGGLVSDVRAVTKRVNGVRHCNSKHDSCVYFLQERLSAHLERNGLSMPEVISSWRDSGVTVCDSGRKTKRARWDGRRLYVVAVKYDALGLDDGGWQQGRFGGERVAPIGGVGGTASDDDFADEG